MKRSIFVVVVILSVANIALADTFGTGDNQFTIDFVSISGDASKANGTNISQYSLGQVAYRSFTDPGDYRMGTCEITNDQWDKFTNIYGIPTGSPAGAYKHSTYWTGADVPANNVSWQEVAQFVNYLNTSTGHQAAYKFTGTQGTDNYTLDVWESGDAGYDSSNPHRNSNAYYFLPTEDEWVKAAYWGGRKLQTYATKAHESLTQGDGTSGTGWNYNDSGNAATDPPGPWDVGSGSEELNGTFDMMGNVWEWTESPWIRGNYVPTSARPLRGGGGFAGYGLVNHLSSTFRDYEDPHHDSTGRGFRVASVPEPCSFILAGDIDGNCEVNLADLALMAANWLINCLTNPTDTACVPK